jgi:hypothetical protein
VDHEDKNHVETLCLFSALSNKKSRGCTQATTATTATTATATTPSKRRKRLTRSNQRAGAIRARRSKLAVHFVGLAD